KPRLVWFYLLSAFSAGCASSELTAPPVESVGGAGGAAGASPASTAWTQADGNGWTRRADASSALDAVLSRCSVHLPCSTPSSTTPCTAGGLARSGVYLSGSGFDVDEGELVVGSERVPIRSGAFSVYLGYKLDCELTTIYRIDRAGDAHCDDGIDLVYAVGPAQGGLTVTGNAPGTAADCSAFPGYDLELSGSCYPGCNAIRVGLFDDAGAQLQSSTIDAVAEPTLVFPGLVEPGKTYEVRFWFQNAALNLCNAGTQAWRRRFVGQSGLNHVDISPDEHVDVSACFQ
ncbi:MAG TPA: hypothetical protein VGM29_14720, partial [Polyangiaceae bacterium]